MILNSLRTGKITGNFYNLRLLQKDIASYPDSQNNWNHYRAALSFVNFRLFHRAR